MPLLIIILGIAITLVALVTIVLNGRNIEKNIEKFESFEEEMQNLRREVEKATREFKNTSADKLGELDKKIKDLNRAGTLVESRVKEGQSIVKILENTIKKSSNIEVNNQKRTFSKSEMLELYKKGYGIKEIAKKSGKSLEELRDILGL